MPTGNAGIDDTRTEMYIAGTEKISLEGSICIFISYSRKGLLCFFVVVMYLI